MKNFSLAIASVFVWIGFVGAISFMEAWLKFQAPGISIPLGLGIGRLVFSALNKVEWVAIILIFVNFLFANKNYKHWKEAFLLVAILILMVQTFYLLPALDARAELHIQHQPVPPSNLHFIYIFSEIIKTACLIFYGFYLLNLNNLLAKSFNN